MEYRKFNDKYVIRIDKGEEVITTLKSLCDSENILLGSVSAIGATNNVEMGLFDTTSKVYHSRKMECPLEITSLVGNISRKDGEVYLHLHINVADEEGHVYGGHLNSCIISATCEMIVSVIDGSVNRKLSEEIGLNLFEYENWW